MNSKTYEKPAMHVVMLEAEDVVCTSSEIPGENPEPFPG